MSHLSIGPTLQSLRKAANLTQEELANKADVATSTIAKIESGAIKDPFFHTILSLAHALGVKVEDFTNRPIIETSENTDIKFVYCDVNGVLVRFFQRGFVSLAEKIHRDVGQVETAFWHYNAAVNKGEMTIKQFNAAIAKRLGVKKIDWQSEYMTAVEAVPDMHHCLAEVCKNTPVGLLTNISTGFLPVMIKNGLVPDLSYANIVDSSRVGAIKPEPEIYDIAEKMSGFSGSEILFIDDSRTNLMAAERLGWRVLWFDDYRPEESVKRVEATLKTN